MCLSKNMFACTFAHPSLKEGPLHKQKQVRLSKYLNLSFFFSPLKIDLHYFTIKVRSFIYYNLHVRKRKYDQWCMRVNWLNLFVNHWEVMFLCWLNQWQNFICNVFLVMYCFLGFHVSWDSVFESLLEDGKLHQFKISRPRGD